MMYRNFTLDEFVRSATADKLGIDNTPDTDSIAHIGELCGSVLQPLRDAWGKPIRITSGYRCEALNKAVGGAENSAHLKGYAADCVPADKSLMSSFADFVEAWVKQNNVPFDQIIREVSGKSEWIHIAVRRNNGEQRKWIFGITI